MNVSLHVRANSDFAKEQFFFAPLILSPERLLCLFELSFGFTCTERRRSSFAILKNVRSRAIEQPSFHPKAPAWHFAFSSFILADIYREYKFEQVRVVFGLARYYIATQRRHPDRA